MIKEQLLGARRRWLFLLALLLWLAACARPQPQPPVDPPVAAPTTDPVDPAGEPRVRWRYPTTAGLPLALVPDQRGLPYLYVAQQEGGLLVLQETAPDSPPRAVAHLPVTQLGELAVMNLTQQGSYLYLALGNFFARAGARAGLAVVDVTAPAQPRLAALWTSATTVGGSSAVLVDGAHVYLAAMEAGLFFFTVAEPAQITLSATLLPDIHFPRANPSAVAHPNARGLALQDHWLYVANDAGGLRVIDVRDPDAPREVAHAINPHLAGKAQAYNNLVLAGTLAYVAVDYCGLEIWDLREPTQPELVGWWNPWGCARGGNLWFNSAGHTNQLAFDPTQQLVYLAAGDSELQVVQVADPRRPTLVAAHGAPKDRAGAWGLALGEETVYLTYIRAVVPFQGNWRGIVAFTRL